MDVISVFLDILEGIAGFFNAVLGLVNPDPFPEIINDMTFDSSDPLVQGWAWLNNFIDVGALLLVFQAWLEMFLLAWAIMLLWRWIKARS